MARTQKEILKACEKRMAELEEQAERIKAREREAAAKEAVSCGRCRWMLGDSASKASAFERKHCHVWGRCGHPLVKGFDRAPSTVDVLLHLRKDVRPWEAVALCGAEKALWEPRRTIWGRVREALSVLLRGPSLATVQEYEEGQDSDNYESSGGFFWAPDSATAKTTCTTFWAVPQKTSQQHKETSHGN